MVRLTDVAFGDESDYTRQLRDADPTRHGFFESPIRNASDLLTSLGIKFPPDR